MANMDVMMLEVCHEKLFTFINDGTKLRREKIL